MTEEVIENNGKLTNADIARRVERLEHAQDVTDRKVDTVDAKVSSLKEIMSLRLDNLTSIQSVQGLKMDAFIDRIDKLILDTTKQSGDINSSVIGRQIVVRLDDLDKGRKENEAAIQKVQARVAYYAGGLAMLTGILSIFGGTIAKSIGLPIP